MQTPFEYRLRKVSVLLSHFYERTGMTLPPQCDNLIDVLKMQTNGGRDDARVEQVLGELRTCLGMVSAPHELAKADIRLLIADIDELLRGLKIENY